MLSDNPDVVENYRARVRQYTASHEIAARSWGRVTNLRLVAFILLAAALWWRAAGNAEVHLVSDEVVALTLAGFVSLLTYSSRAKAQMLRLADLIAVNEQSTHRVRRNWSALEPKQWQPAPASHPYAADLDVFGSASLVQLFPPLSSVPGRTTLRSWLLAPATASELQSRQQAVAELKTKVDWRDELAVLARRINISAERMQRFERWAHDEGWLTGNRWLVIATICLPVATALLAIGQSVGILAYPFWLLTIALGSLLTWRFGAALKQTLSGVPGQANVIEGYTNVARLLRGETFHSAALRQIQQDLGSGARGAVREMRTLNMLADCAEVRLSPLLHFVLQALTLWDFHVAHLLEKWQHGAGPQLPGWMAALGTAESLAALATVAHDNPDWTFPAVDESEPVLMDAKALGHPLLAASVRVANDVTVGPPGTLLFVTRSNMAGKSTLLRAIGLNVVLGQAGSVVCASTMRCPPVALYTSMRVQDSLERGVSYFMAELERLKLIVDAADASSRVHGRTVMYLLDEILHGTNSAERAIAARYVLERLIGLGAIGAVTTHDLQLADADTLTRAAQHVHFRESFDQTGNARPAMYFDYVLQRGKATSSNALKLLELVGLGPGVDHLPDKRKGLT